jgi:hypothetical protein
MACDKDVLVGLATRFRTAIIESEPRSLIGSLTNYPNGACEDASYLLARYFADQGCGEFEFVLGVRKQKSHSHAWLEQEGLIVDITADQFKGMNSGVFVSQNGSWHRQFIEENRHIADYVIRYRNSTDNTLANLNDSYMKIIRNIV